MRILANENLPRAVVEELQRRGHDVKWIRRECPGATDPEVLALASAEERLVLTFDKDFGELAFHHRLPASSGIVLFRIAPLPGSAFAAFAGDVPGARTNWAGHFTVIEEHRIRMTALPVSTQ